MQIPEFRKRYAPQLKAFFETEAGQAFTRTLSALDPARNIKPTTSDDELVNHSVPLVSKIFEFNRVLTHIITMSKPIRAAAKKRKSYGGQNIPRTTLTKTDKPK